MKKQDDSGSEVDPLPRDGYWLENKLEQRRLAALARVQARNRKPKKKKIRRLRLGRLSRGARRDLALFMLTLSVLLLGVLVIEIVIKAVNLYRQFVTGPG